MTSEQLVLVCGSRRYDPICNHGIRDHIKRLPNGTTVMHGGAPGADYWAGWFAKQRGLQVREFKADWKAHGKAAGPIRNRQMLDENPDLVIAFPDKKSKGTRDTIAEARRRGIPVRVIDLEDTDAA